MAALNTLRTKGAVFMTAMIAFALLAFLVSDNNFMNQSPDVIVGTVNGEDISIKRYMQEIEDETFYSQFITGNSSLSAQETEELNNRMWQKLVLNDIFGTSTHNLGLEVGDDELVDMAQGKYLSPVLSSLFADQTGQIDRDGLVGFVSSLDMDPSGNSRKFWNQIEENIQIEREMSKYLAVVSNGTFVTDVDAAASFAASKDMYDVKFVAVPFSQDSVAVSDSEIKAFYEQNIKRFRTQPYRKISYVSFESVPSESDYAEAQKDFDALVAEFTTSENPEHFVELNSEVKFDNRYYSENNINPEFKEFAFGKSSEDIYVAPFVGNIHTAIRVSDEVMTPDSISFRVLPLLATNNIDSITNVILTQKGGFDKMLVEYAVAPDALVQPSQTVNTSDLAEQKLLSAQKGQVINLGTNNGYVTLVYIERTTPKVLKKQIAQFTKEVVSSAKTDQVYYAQANEFADKVHAAGASFDEVAIDMAAVKRVATVRSEDRTVSNIPDTKEIVRFAYNSKEGAISNVISTGGTNYIAVVTEIVDSEYVPLADVKEGLELEIRAKKNTETLKAEMSKLTSLEAVAEKYSVEINDAEGLTYASMFIPGLGLSPEFVGEMVVTPLNTVSKPVASTNSVALFTIANQTPQDDITIQSEKIMIESINSTNLEDRILSSIINKAKIEDFRILYM